MENILLTAIGAIVTLGGTFLALIKSGHIQVGKKENGLSAKLEKIESNDLHSIAESLKRIEDKLGEIHDNILIVKTKVNDQ